MDAYISIMTKVGEVRLNDLREEAARQRLARSIRGSRVARRGLIGGLLRRRRSATGTGVTVPFPASHPDTSLRRSA